MKVRECVRMLLGESVDLEGEICVLVPVGENEADPILELHPVEAFCDNGRVLVYCRPTLKELVGEERASGIE